MTNEANIWNPRKILSLSADTKRIEERQTAIAGQTFFTIKDFAYALSTGSLAVYKNGLLLAEGIDWTENTTITFSLVVPAAAGDQIVAVGYVAITANVDVRDTDIYISNYQAIRDYTDTEITLYAQGRTTFADGGEDFYHLVTGKAIGFFVDDNNRTIVPTGGDGSSAWLQKTRRVINVLDYDAKGDGVTDDTVAIQAAVTAAGTLGLVFFPKPTVEYTFGSTITVPSSQTWRGEVDWVSTLTPTVGMSRLRFTGVSTVAIAASEMQWVNMVLTGNINTTFAPNTSTGITNTGNLRLVGSTVRGFATGILMSGGFYHVFTRCNFFHNNTCFTLGVANNVVFTDCRFNAFEIACTSDGGAGMVAFKGCAFERWTNRVYSHLSGATNALTWHQCYIENYPTVAVATGLADPGGTGFYDKAIFASAGRAITITDSLMSLKGVKRLVTGTSHELIRLEGNRIFLFAAGVISPNETENIVGSSGIPDLFIQKDSITFFDSSGSETTHILSGMSTVQILSGSLGAHYDYLDFNASRVQATLLNNFVEGDYTLTPSDNGKLIEVNTDGTGVPATVTVPSLPSGFHCHVMQRFIHTITIVADTNTTLQSADNIFTTHQRFSILEITRRTTNQFVVAGDLTKVIAQDPQTGTTFTPDAINANQSMELTNASAITCTIPPNSSVPYAIGTSLHFEQGGAGRITFVPGAGVTLQTEIGLKTIAQRSDVRAYKKGTDTWLLTGRLGV